MNFDLADVLSVANPGTILVATLIGLLVGRLFFGDRRSSRPYLVSVYGIGLSFTTALGTARYFQDAPQWEAYVGIAILWTVFITAASASSRTSP